MEQNSNAKVGGIAVLIILLLGVYLLYLALPFLVSIATNLLSLVVSLLLIAGFLVILLHPKTRFGIGSLINSLFRRK